MVDTGKEYWRWVNITLSQMHNGIKYMFNFNEGEVGIRRRKRFEKLCWTSVYWKTKKLIFILVG